jgi:Family of unknown function (DUF5681)
LPGIGKSINRGEKIEKTTTKEGEIDFRDIHHVRKPLKAARSLDQGRESKSVFRRGRIGGPVMNDREPMIDSLDDDMYGHTVIDLPEDEDPTDPGEAIVTAPATDLIPAQDADQKPRSQPSAAGQNETPLVPEQAADQKPRGRPFKPGKSGNPNGRPKGSRNKATLLMEALLEGEAENITRKLIEKAIAGHFPAMRFCGDRLLAPRRSRTVQFELPPIETPEDAQKAASAVVTACANGELTTTEAKEFMSLIQAYASLTPSEPSAADMISGDEASSRSAGKTYRSTSANLLSLLRGSNARSNSQGD